MKNNWQKKEKRINEILENNKSGGKRYCFLDFDGVINIYYEEGTEKYKILLEKSKKFQFSDDDCVRYLSQLCLKYDLQIVVSSSWRFSGLSYCKSYLYHAGLDYNVPVVDILPLEIDDSREDLIYSYLHKHPDFQAFIILDDMQLEHLENYQVLCKDNRGFDEGALQEAESKLSFLDI